MATPTELKTMTLLPPAPGRCVECANIHEPDHPHNLLSLYYQVKFYQEHGAAPVGNPNRPKRRHFARNRCSATQPPAPPPTTQEAPFL